MRPVAVPLPLEPAPCAPRARGSRAPLYFVLAAILLACPFAPADETRYRSESFRFPTDTSKIVPADGDGDGKSDLFVVRPGHFAFYRQGEDGFQFGAPTAEVRLGGDAFGWDVVDLTGGGRYQIVALVDGNVVRTWAYDDGAFGSPTTLHANLSASLPRGFYPLRFARDVDGDGDADLVIPRPGYFQIHLRTPNGEYEPGPRVASEMDISLELEAGDDLGSRVGQSVQIPVFSIRDFNGDGRVDLVSHTDKRFEVHLARPEKTFARRPSFTIDMAAVRKALGPAHGDDLDASNILAPATRTAQLIARDVNRDGAEDLLLRSGGRVDLYLGSREGIDTKHIDQRLKASGNVVAVGLFDEDGDGRDDLWLFRVETVSLTEAAVWLLVSGSLEFEFLVYRFEESRFTRRPSRRITVTLRFPPLLRFIRNAEEMRLGGTPKSRIPAAEIDLAGSGERQDIVIIDQGRLTGYFGAATQLEALPEAGGIVTAIQTLTNYTADQDEYSIDMEKISDLIPTPGARLAQAVAGRGPDLELPMTTTTKNTSLFLADLNGDGRDDMIVIHNHDDTGIQGEVILSR